MLKAPRVITLIAAIIFLSLLVLTLFQVEHLDEKWFRVFSIFGILASALGLFIVVIQIFALKSISQFTRETAENTRNRIISFLHASDISKSIKIIQEIQIYNRIKKFEISILRMQELKYSLVQIKNNSKFEEMIKVTDFSNHITDLSININSVEKELQRQTNFFKHH